MFHPTKIDKDSFHTSLAIAVTGALLVGLINLGLGEIKEYLSSRRPKDNRDEPPPPTTPEV